MIDIKESKFLLYHDLNAAIANYEVNYPQPDFMQGYMVSQVRHYLVRARDILEQSMKRSLLDVGISVSKDLHKLLNTYHKLSDETKNSMAHYLRSLSCHLGGGINVDPERICSELGDQNQQKSSSKWRYALLEGCEKMPGADLNEDLRHLVHSLHEMAVGVQALWPGAMYKRRTMVQRKADKYLNAWLDENRQSKSRNDPIHQGRLELWGGPDYDEKQLFVVCFPDISLWDSRKVCRDWLKMKPRRQELGIGNGKTKEYNLDEFDFIDMRAMGVKYER